VRASGSATVEASGSATVEAYDSATVRAYGSATVRAYDSATVEASGSATVRAYDSATVRAYGSATVEAYDSATVEASGSATVRAYGSATVEASKFVAIHRYGTRAKVNGGVLIQIPECKTGLDWIDYYGLTPEDESVVLFKAVGADFKSGHGADYTPGTTVTADDFDPQPHCGQGLHFGPRPHLAARYHHAAVTRYIACRVKVADIVVIESWGRPGDKIKARSCDALYECNADGDRLAETAVSS
jgi:hypothetical protein